jgi:hypothetical protein
VEHAQRRRALRSAAQPPVGRVLLVLAQLRHQVVLLQLGIAPVSLVDLKGRAQCYSHYCFWSHFGGEKAVFLKFAIFLQFLRKKYVCANIDHWDVGKLKRQPYIYSLLYRDAPMYIEDKSVSRNM